MKVKVKMNYDAFVAGLMSEQVAEFMTKHREEIASFIPEVRACIGFEQNNPYHIYDVYEHTIRTLHHAPADFIIRMALFFHDIGKPESYSEDERGGHFIGHGRISAEIADRVLERWEVDGDMRREIVQLIFYHDATFSTKRLHIRKWAERLGEIQYRRLIALKRADTLGQNPIWAPERLEKLAQMEVHLAEVLEDMKRMTTKDLDITGKELLELGYSQGTGIGEVLKQMLEQVLDGKLENRREVLLSFAARALSAYRVTASKR